MLQCQLHTASCLLRIIHCDLRLPPSFNKAQDIHPTGRREPVVACDSLAPCETKNLQTSITLLISDWLPRRQAKLEGQIVLDDCPKTARTHGMLGCGDRRNPAGNCSCKSLGNSAGIISVELERRSENYLPCWPWRAMNWEMATFPENQAGDT